MKQHDIDLLISWVKEAIQEMNETCIKLSLKKISYDINKANDCYGPAMNNLLHEIQNLKNELSEKEQVLANYIVGTHIQKS